MPNCFALTLKGEDEPTKLTVIDHRLWVHFQGAEPAPPPGAQGKWFCNWYNTVGLLLAVGRSLEDIATDPELGETMNAIAQYLYERYDESAWYSPR